ncbi:unnamed protein product [Sphagnum balticum]
MESNHAKGAHVVAFPLPLGGHHARFVPFIKILARNGLTITVITTMHYIAKTQHALMEDNHLEAYDNIRVIGLPTENEEVKVDNAQVVRGIEHLKNPLRDMMKQLIESNGATNGESPDPCLFGPPACLISDFCIPWIQDIANEFNMPRYGFYPTTHYLSLIFNLPDFYKKGFLPILSNNKPLKIPGFPPILPCDVPKSVFDSNQKRVYEGERLWEAAGVLVNSAYELESSIFNGLHDMICKIGHAPKIFTIGPMVYENIQPQETFPQVTENNNECLLWLNNQPKASVLYICFGTQSTFPMQQMNEFALGLEASGVRFLWVVKVQSSEKESTSDIATFFPKGFMEKMKKRSLIYTSFAPQLQILAHPAIGGFLTHCGWNSITESIAMGVPMIAWPLGADQMLNSRLCVDVLDIALPVHNNLNESIHVGHEEVERVIRLLMEDARGQIIKEKVEDLNKIIQIAVGPKGSSCKNLLLFVEEVNSLRSK